METNLKALQFVAEALENKNFAAISEEVKQNMVSEINEMISDAYNNYNLYETSREAFIKNYNNELRLLASIAQNAPGLLQLPALRDFLEYLYEKGGGFEGMIKIMGATDVDKMRMAKFAAQNMGIVEVPEWIVTHWVYCEPFRKEIIKAARKLRFDQLEAFASRETTPLLRAAVEIISVATGIVLGCVIGGVLLGYFI